MSLWLCVPLVPLLAAVICVRWPRLRLLVALAPVPALALALWPPVAVDIGWLWFTSRWGAESLFARYLLGFTALLWTLAGLQARLNESLRSRRFWLFWALSLTGNLLLLIAVDAASFYVGFTLMSLAAYGLIIEQGGPAPRQAGRLYLQLAILGEMLLFAGLMLRLQETGQVLLLSEWLQIPTGAWTTALLLLGFGLKAGFWPLHVWLPLAHPAAPAPASAVLSGAMIKAGVLGVWLFMPASGGALSPAFWLALGLFSAFYGALLGMGQQQAKKALAYSSISQMGYLLAIVALAWQQPDARAGLGLLLALFALHHALAKGALFMGAGLAAHHRFHGWQQLMLWLPALALAGLPLLSGGAVKTLLKKAVYDSDVSHWLWLFSLGSVATALVLARALWLMNRQSRAHSPLRLSRSWPLLVLVVLSLLAPWFLSSLRAAMLDHFALSGLWALLWPLLVAALIAAAVWRWPPPEKYWRFLQASPARRASLGVKRLWQMPAKPASLPKPGSPGWRGWERRCNRLWQRQPLGLTVAMMSVLLLLGWFW